MSTEVKHGTFTLVIADELTLSPEAGTLSSEQVSRISKAPIGVQLLCEDTADGLEKAGAKFAGPPGVTPQTLREAGARVEKIDQVIQDGEVVMTRLRQQAILYKAEAYGQACKVNDFVRAQGKHNAEIKTLFQRAISFFARLRTRKASVAAPVLAAAPLSEAAPGSK